MHWTNRNPQDPGRLHQADGLTNPLLARCERYQGHRQGTETTQQPVGGTEAKELPGVADQAHQDRDENEERQRSLQHQFVTVAIGQGAPKERRERREQRCNTQHCPRPQRSTLRISDPKLLHVEGQEGQDEVEAQQRDKDAEDENELVALQGRQMQARHLSTRHPRSVRPTPEPYPPAGPTPDATCNGPSRSRSDRAGGARASRRHSRRRRR